MFLSLLSLDLNFLDFGPRFGYFLEHCWLPLASPNPPWDVPSPLRSLRKWLRSLRCYFWQTWAPLVSKTTSRVLLWSPRVSFLTNCELSELKFKEMLVICLEIRCIFQLPDLLFFNSLEPTIHQSRNLVSNKIPVGHFHVGNHPCDKQTHIHTDKQPNTNTQTNKQTKKHNQPTKRSNEQSNYQRNIQANN